MIRISVGYNYNSVTIVESVTLIVLMLHVGYRLSKAYTVVYKCGHVYAVSSDVSHGTY